MSRRAVATVLGALTLAAVLLVLGCATTPPPYLCQPAVTDTGQQVIYCLPYRGQAER